MNGEFDTTFINIVNDLEDKKDEEGLALLYAEHQDPACRNYISEAIAFAMDKTQHEVEQALNKRFNINQG